MYDLKSMTSKNTTTSIDNLIKLRKSYFSEALEYTLESTRKYNSDLKVLYKTILESNNEPVVIQESFYDFYNKVIEMIDNFLKFIKSMVDRFIIEFFSIVKSDNYIKNNKDKLKNFKDAIDIKGYNYTFSDSIPLITAVIDFKDDIDTYNMDVKKGYSTAKKRLIDDYYDYFRATVIGRTGRSIESADFANELFAEYRDGWDEPRTITVREHDLSNYIASFDNYKRFESDVKNKKKDIEKQYTEIKKDFKSLSSSAKITDYEIEKVSNLFIKLKTSQIEKMSSIHSMAFAAKLDAIKECYKQDKDILYKALKQSVKYNKED